jgi:hypothetical protein
MVSNLGVSWFWVSAACCHWSGHNNDDGDWALRMDMIVAPLQSAYWKGSFPKVVFISNHQAGQRFPLKFVDTLSGSRFSQPWERPFQHLSAFGRGIAKVKGRSGGETLT